MDSKELREQYEKETGEKAVDKSTGHSIPTWSYAEWLEQRIAAISAPASASVYPNILKDVDSDWDTEKNEGAVTCHSRMIGGVLCRWWGDGPEPSGIVKINAALSAPAPAVPVADAKGVSMDGWIPCKRKPAAPGKEQG